MYNSVKKSVEISCIDHVYCNFKHRCSTPRVIVSDDSDHDLISYVRFSKPPPSPSHTIRRRSYKNFIEEDFLTDVSTMDWSDVYAAEDVDVATETFTNKFRYILNQHASWIIFQQRKNYHPWIREDTKDQMKERDAWKARFKVLTSANPGEASDEQVSAWNEYKKVRNSINNKKPYEEAEYKKEKNI